MEPEEVEAYLDSALGREHRQRALERLMEEAGAEEDSTAAADAAAPDEV